VNRDNLLFAVLGLLVGFVSAYWMFEAMAARQPARVLPGQMVTMPQQGAPGGASAPGMGGAAQGDASNPSFAPMQAIQELRAYVEKNPNDAEAVLKLANANYDIQNWDRARQLYSHYLTLRPDQPDVLTDLGITYRNLGQFDQALDLFARAQQVSPDHWQSRFNAVIVLAFDKKDFARAETVLAELRQLQPGNAEVERLAAAVEREKNSA
jgi:cytochrome c-type biogenesis protein CcmH/NrfG